MKILWLKTELLHPIDRGGKIRTYQMLKELKRDHHITYLALEDGTASKDARERAEEYCHELVRVPHRTSAKLSAGFYAELALNIASPLPYFIQKYASAGMRREIENRLSQDEFDVVVCDFLMPSVNLPAHVRPATMLFQHNVEAVIWKRHYEAQTNRVKKAYLRNQWVKAVAYEGAACRRFDHIVAVSRNDLEMMQSAYGVNHISEVPTGVDTEYFRPGRNERREHHNLVFTGAMDWLPNDDAIRYFVEQILPRIKQKVPDVTLTVVGRDPFPGLVELSERDPSIIVTGRVEDVRPYIERATAYVVPMRIGSGTRLKIYEAMAMEKPIVSTAVGAEGLPVRDGVELMLADDPEAFAEAVARVLSDEAFARELGTRAAQTVREQFGWDRVAGRFAELCEQVVLPTNLNSRRAKAERRIGAAV